MYANSTLTTGTSEGIDSQDFADKVFQICHDIKLQDPDRARYRRVMDRADEGCKIDFDGPPLGLLYASCYLMRPEVISKLDDDFVRGLICIISDIYSHAVLSALDHQLQSIDKRDGRDGAQKLRSIAALGLFLDSCVENATPLQTSGAKAMKDHLSEALISIIRATNGHMFRDGFPGWDRLENHSVHGRLFIVTEHVEPRLLMLCFW